MIGRIAPCLATAALALFAATTGVAANPDATYTCTKTKKNGQEDVRVGVPESAVPGLTNAGFTCVPNTADPEDENSGGDDPTGDDAGDESSGDENPGDENPPVDVGSHHAGPSVEAFVAQESRSLYCSTSGPVFRANGEEAGIALDLPDTAGAQLVESGLARPANFYQGVGASCDPMPGFTDSGAWVDHVGNVVPGVAVYPMYVPVSAD